MTSRSGSRHSDRSGLCHLRQQRLRERSLAIDRPIGFTTQGHDIREIEIDDDTYKLLIDKD